ncbi:MAG: molybdopterin cofactor-binding domain-containing protein [Thermodesulfobacteriota bacterium]
MEEQITIALTINGRNISPTVPAGLTLLSFLRNELKLTGAKNGCNTGHCGACTVLVNGEAKKSCRLPLRRLQNAEVVTIEGIAAGEDRQLHPIQAAFLAAGAVQCGFCTPGMILAAKALLDKNPNPTEADIRSGLEHNLCRCTGYLKIIEAVRLAAHWVRHPLEMKLEMRGGYGRSVIDIDGFDKVQGKLHFADDLYPGGVLFAKVVWSSHPHARIRRVEKAEALKLAGVAHVLTAEDVPGHNGFGSLTQDQPVLCGDTVRFMGDAVALVLAESEEIAAKARDLIQVEYDPLPGVFSPREGLGKDAPMIHPQGNVCKHLVHTVGDTAEGFSRSDLVLEGHFSTPFVEHGYLEPEAGIAFWSGDVLTVKAPTQFPFELKGQLAAVLDMPADKLRIQATPLGGAFGSKADATVEPLIALGTYHSKKPVKLTLTREESMKRSTKRHPYEMDYRVGFDRSGKLLAVDARLVSDAGPYTALSPRVIDQACIFACGPYEVPNLRVEGWAVYTNNANSSAFRGFGINQVAVAIESLFDEAARKLKIDPFEIRYRNALKAGSATPSGEILRDSVAMQEAIAAAREALKEELPGIREMAGAGKKLGIGVAAGFKNVGAGKGKVDDAGAVFTLLPGGRVRLRASAVDMGQGIRTTLAQITREIIPLSETDFEMVTGDTTLTPRHGGAIAERQTLISGNAVAQAAEKFRAALAREAARLLARPATELDLVESGFICRASNRTLSLKELESQLSRQGRTIEIGHTYIAPKTFALSDSEGRKSVPPEEYRNYPSYAYTCQVAILEVDPGSGKVKLLKVIAAHDVGKAINPQKIEGQIEGSCHMAQGYALSEAYPMKGGVARVRTLKGLNMPTILEAPPVRTLIVEKPEPCGPFGAKGISEVATVPLTPAILNAICDAVGVRIYSLPATPDKILDGLSRKRIDRTP